MMACIVFCSWFVAEAAPPDGPATTASELSSALALAQAGDEILLAPGDYGEYTFQNLSYGNYVTVRSADPDNPAAFDQITVDGVQFLAIDSVHVDNPTNGASGSKVVGIDNSSNILFANSEVNGSVSTSTGYREFQGHYGVWTGANASDIRIENNYIHDVKNGLYARHSSDVEVVSNRFDRLGNDTMKFSLVDSVLIEDNVGPKLNFPAPTAHVDFIQFQGTSQNITIRGNIALAGDNFGKSQAIFLADGSYDNVLIEQNIIYTGSGHGITVYSGDNVEIRDNTVLNGPGLNHKATKITSPEGAVVTGNIISTTQYDGGVKDGNLYVQHAGSSQSYYYDDLFADARTGLGTTLEDLRPIEGSAAESYGAYERLMELLT